MEGTRKTKDVQKRLNRMAALPFLVFLGSKYDILNDSLSRIGWQLGGFRFLISVHCSSRQITMSGFKRREPEQAKRTET